MAPAAPGPVGKRSAIKIGSVGTLSGPIGSAVLPMVRSAQAWAKVTNTKGGLGGHMIEYVVADDANDPARHRALVQQLVEDQGVLAFMMQGGILVGQSALAYLTEKRIPVVGIIGGEYWAHDSPMLFPQASSGSDFNSTIYASISAQSLALGKKKLGIIRCSESDVCSRIAGQAQEAEARGMELVYQGQSSLAQPDFTAECLAARNAGTEVLFIILDGNSLRRVSASCARQGYRPLFGSSGTVLADDMKADPNLDGHLIANSSVHPYFGNAPTMAQYLDAMKAVNQSPSGSGTLGWAAAKLFERVALNLPEPPTTAAILRNLWSLRGDDLGGLTMPVTFTEGQNPPHLVCWWNIAIRAGRWQSPDGFTRTCD